MALAAPLAFQIGDQRAAAGSRQAARTAEFFEAKVRPVLAANCYDCHGDQRYGGLRLDSREAMLKGGRSGPAIVPGDPDKSLMIEAVRQTSPTLKMPKGGRLKPDEIEALVEWVQAGAVWPASAASTEPASAAAVGKPAAPRRLDPRRRTYVITPQQRAFWSFQPIRKPPVPVVSHGDWAKTGHRSIRARAAGKGRPHAGAPGGQAHAHPARDTGSDRTATDAGGDRRVRERHRAGRVREGGRSPARVAALRRNVGPAVARRRAVRRGRLSLARSEGPAA